MSPNESIKCNVANTNYLNDTLPQINIYVQTFIYMGLNPF